MFKHRTNLKKTKSLNKSNSSFYKSAKQLKSKFLSTRLSRSRSNSRSNLNDSHSTGLNSHTLSNQSTNIPNEIFLGQSFNRGSGF